MSEFADDLSIPCSTCNNLLNDDYYSLWDSEKMSYINVCGTCLDKKYLKPDYFLHS